MPLTRKANSRVEPKRQSEKNLLEVRFKAAFSGKRTFAYPWRHPRFRKGASVTSARVRAVVLFRT